MRLLRFDDGGHLAAAASFKRPRPLQQESPSKRTRFFPLHDNDDDDVTSASPAAPHLAKRHAPEVRTNGKEKKNAVNKQRREVANTLMQGRTQLPVYAGRSRIVQEVQDNATVIILGETGSGKTTQIPQYLLSAAASSTTSSTRRPLRIAVTQPRRVATTSLASRVAQEVGCQLGGYVGYSVRFDDKTNTSTRLKFLTDGTLLQEILGDSELRHYDVVVVDEAHERTLRGDMCMGFLKDIQKRRANWASKGQSYPQHVKPRKGESCAEDEKVVPLKIVVMSATIDAERFSSFFDGAKILYIKGRQHPVNIHYLKKPVDDYVDCALKTILTIHAKHPPGDILVFVPGQEDIESLQGQLQTYISELPPSLDQISICPLYARLPPSEQQKAFLPTPPRTRKVVLSTNVAETSVTIPGIKHVIDTGFVKVKRFHHGGGVEQLNLEPVSRSSALQRTGRAGRESAGRCWRLYTQETFNELQMSLDPEVKRCSFVFTVLHLLAAGVEDVFSFMFMDAPSVDDLKHALVQLLRIGAIQGVEGGGQAQFAQQITPLGHRMAQLPLDPPLARALLASMERGCAVEIIDLISLLESVDSLLINTAATREAAVEARLKYMHRDGDHLTLLNLVRAYDVAVEEGGHQLAQQWCRDHYISIKAMSNVMRTRKQVRERLTRLGMAWQDSRCGDDTEHVMRSLLEGLPCQVSLRRPDGTYRHATSPGLSIKIHPSSSLMGRGVDVFLYHELTRTSAVYARICSRVKHDWLLSNGRGDARQPPTPT